MMVAWLVWMATASLERSATELAPLVGAAGLLVYLLKQYAWERGRWIRERSAMIVEHREELDRKEADYERHIAYLRDRIQHLEGELQRERTRNG